MATDEDVALVEVARVVTELKDNLRKDVDQDVIGLLLVAKHLLQPQDVVDLDAFHVLHDSDPLVAVLHIVFWDVQPSVPLEIRPCALGISHLFPKVKLLDNALLEMALEFAEVNALELVNFAHEIGEVYQLPDHEQVQSSLCP